MELGTFLSNRVTQDAVSDLVRQRLNPADRGYLGAEYLPEVFLDVDEYKRSIWKLGPAIIANDVAPLSTGRFGSKMERQRVGGGLIDSAAHMHYDGEEIEMFISLIKDLPGETVRANMPALTQYLRLTDVHLLEPLDMNRERKRWTLMGTGQAYPDGAADDDFTKPPVLDVYSNAQTNVIPAGNARNIYGGADADFFLDYREAVDAARADGYPILEAVMHSRTRQAILDLASTKQALGGTTLNVISGGQLQVQQQAGAVSADAFNAALSARGLPPVTVYDGTWATQVRAVGDAAGAPGTFITRPYIPLGRVIYVPQASPVDASIITEPSVPQRTLTPFGNQRRIGIHVIGRPTGQSEGGKVYLFGPNFHPGVNPNMDGDSINAHMPFLNFPGGFRVTEYAQV